MMKDECTHMCKRCMQRAVDRELPKVRAIGLPLRVLRIVSSGHFVVQYNGYNVRVTKLAGTWWKHDLLVDEQMTAFKHCYYDYMKMMVPSPFVARLTVYLDNQ